MNKRITDMYKIDSNTFLWLANKALESSALDDISSQTYIDY